MNYKNTFLLLLAGIFMLISCNDKKELTDLSLKERKQILSDLSDQTANEISKMDAAGFVDALNSFAYYIDNSSYFSDMERFNYDDNVKMIQHFLVLDILQIK